MRDYNGYPNKITWLAALYLEQWNRLSNYSHVDCAHELATYLRLEIEDELFCSVILKSDNTFLLDVLTYALADIDFLAIAKLEILSRS